MAQKQSAKGEDRLSLEFFGEVHLSINETPQTFLASQLWLLFDGQEKALTWESSDHNFPSIFKQESFPPILGVHFEKYLKILTNN